MFELHYVRETKAENVVEKVKKSAGIEPSLAVFFLTGSLNKEPEKVRLNCDSIGVPVEAVMTPEGIWSTGALVLITDSEVSIQTFTGTASEVCQKLRRAEKGNFNLLIYPLFFIKSRFFMLKNLMKLKRASLEEASKVFEEMFYPMNAILRPFRDEEKTAIALNVFPLKFGIGTPKISLNGRVLGRKVLSVSFEEKVDCDFADTFPRRGKSFEETAEILSNELVNVKKVSVLKRGIAIGGIDGMSVRDFLREQRITMRANLENDVRRSEFFGATPYVICMISRETHGSSALGLMDYDLKFYPSLFDTEVFYEEALFAGEFIRGGIKRVIEKLRESDFAILDQNLMLMFEERTVEIAKAFGGYGIFTSYPSYTGKLGKDFMSEVEERICVNTWGTIAFLNLE